MAETEITVLKPSVNDATTPAAITSADLANGNSYVNDGYTLCVITNADSTNALDVTITTQTPSSAGKIKTIQKTLVAGQTSVINFLDSDFNSNGRILVSYNDLSGTSTTAKILAISPRRPG